MGFLDFLFKNKEDRAKDKRVKGVLKRTDDFIERTEKMHDEMRRDDENCVKFVICCKLVKHAKQRIQYCCSTIDL